MNFLIGLLISAAGPVNTAYCGYLILKIYDTPQPFKMCVLASFLFQLLYFATGDVVRRVNKDEGGTKTDILMTCATEWLIVGFAAVLYLVVR